MRPLRIAMLAHSTNPRGGVVHALELSEALHAMGHHVTLHAPDESGRGFFRPTRCEAVSVPAQPVQGGVAALVRQRVGEYLAYFGGCQGSHTASFDVWHAQDSISANALATLVERGRIHSFVRTVHHLDRFDDAQVMALQERGYRSASQVLCVSRQWREILAREHGVDALQVANGVDTRRYGAQPRPYDAVLKARLGVRSDRDAGPLLLAVGGVEARKNTLAILQAFIDVRVTHPNAQLVIAGGASLLDHGTYRAAFDAALRGSGLRVALGAGPHVCNGDQADVIVTGPLADDDMPSLYRIADALLFPSLKEGFGLVVLEALASGTPVVVSRIAPFTEHLDEGVVSWCDPLDAASIAQAARHALEPERASTTRVGVAALLARYSWQASAAQHVQIYQRLASVRARQPEASHA